MGYESRIIFIEGPFRNEDGEFTMVYPEHTYSDGRTVPTHTYGAVIVDVDLSKCGYNGPVASLIQGAIAAEQARLAEPDAVHFGFFEDGDTFLTEDMYGDPVSPISVELLLEATDMALRESSDAGEPPYRRFKLLEAICRELVTVPRWNNSFGVTALHFGH